MGMFTSVYKDRKCHRCGVTYNCEFQFKTGQDFCERFRDGDRANGVPKGKHVAVRNPLCDPCYAFVIHTLGWIVRQSKSVIFEALPEAELVESNQHRFDKAVRLHGKTVAELGGGGLLMGESISSQWLSTTNPAATYQKLRRALEACWRRHLKVTHLDDYAEIKYEKRKPWGWEHLGKMEYQLKISESVPEWEAAMAVVDRKIEVVDNVENTIKTMQEEELLKSGLVIGKPKKK